jgi:DNA-binding CsgD family transcriptional regulator
MEEKTAREQIESLTKKQRQVLLRVCDEKTYGEIAQELKRSRNTVKSHMRNIYVKLGLEFVPSEDRRVLLREIYCPLLKEITPQPIVVMESEESEEDDDIEIVEGIIVEDENPILLYSPI